MFRLPLWEKMHKEENGFCVLHFCVVDKRRGLQAWHSSEQTTETFGFSNECCCLSKDKVLHYSFFYQRCEFILGEFLKDIKKNHSNVNYANMVNILVLHCQSEGTFCIFHDRNYIAVWKF